MNRLISAIKLDVTLQMRYRFYYAALFITIVWIAVLNPLSKDILYKGLPFVIFTDLGIVGFYMLAGMVLLEKSEATLVALIVTPLRFRDYLFSKLITFTWLSIVISVLVCIFTFGQNLRWGILILAIVLTSILSLLISFIAVAPYSSISSFLLPSQLYMLIMNLPLLHYFGWWESPVLYAIPTHASIILLDGAFHSMTFSTFVYGVVYQMIWIIFLFYLANYYFNHYIVERT